MKKGILKECVKFSKRSLLKKSFCRSLPYYHHFAFVIQGNEIVEWAYNRHGDSPIVYGFGQVHAEYALIRKSKGVVDRRKPIDMVVLRLNKLGELRNSKPCGACMMYIKLIRCRKIWFSTNDGTFQSVNVE